MPILFFFKLTFDLSCRNVKLKLPSIKGLSTKRFFNIVLSNFSKLHSSKSLQYTSSIKYLPIFNNIPILEASALGRSYHLLKHVQCTPCFRDFVKDFWERTKEMLDTQPWNDKVKYC
jgi:hypothetical protein